MGGSQTRAELNILQMLEVLRIAGDEGLTTEGISREIEQRFTTGYFMPDFYRNRSAPLVEKGYIAVEPETRPKIYKITPAGIDFIQTQADRLKALITEVLQRGPNR